MNEMIILQGKKILRHFRYYYYWKRKRKKDGDEEMIREDAITTYMGERE